MSSGFRGATNTGDAYERGDYAGRGRFGPREAGSVLANAPLVGVPSAIAIAAEAAHDSPPLLIWVRQPARMILAKSPTAESNSAEPGENKCQSTVPAEPTGDKQVPLLFLSYRFARMKCRNCNRRFSPSLGGIESSPGIFFYFSLICTVISAATYGYRNLFVVIVFLFAALAAVISGLVCVWECVLMNLR